MSIRFTCSHCGQRLTVKAERAGRLATCPRCKVAVQIPRESTREPGTAAPLSDSGTVTTLPAPEIDTPSSRSAGPGLSFTPPTAALRAAPAEPRVERTTAAPLSQPLVPQEQPSEDRDTIQLPRYVIFTQGFLLLAVGVAAFVLGYAIGGPQPVATPARNTTSSVSTTPGLLVKGSVALRRQGLRAADVGATLLFIPWEAKPSARPTLEGFLPDDDSLTRTKAEQWLREQGGAVTRANERGEFELTLPQPGSYGLLVLSGTAPPPADAAPPAPEEEQLWQYFDLATDPLATRRYQWRKETIRGNTTLNVDFD